MKRNFNIEELIIKYFNNELLDEEAVALLELLKTDNDVKKQFRQYARLNYSLAQISKVEFDKSKSFQKIKTVITTQKRSKNNDSKKSVPLIVWQSSAAALLLIAFTIAFYFYATSEQIIQTNSNSILAYKLPDGSTVTLNRNSKLIVPRKFIGNTRKVFLSGEAYFEVAPDKKKTFIVETKFINVTVCGTKFNVYEDTTLHGGIFVIVDEGQVKVSNNTEPQSVNLNEGDIAFYNTNSKHIEVKKNKNLNYLSWKTGILLFQETPLNEVVNDLSKHYQVNIIIENSALNNCKLDAKIINYKIEEVFQMLETVFDINIRKENNIYIISGSGC